MQVIEQACADGVEDTGTDASSQIFAEKGGAGLGHEQCRKRTDNRRHQSVVAGQDRVIDQEAEAER